MHLLLTTDAYGIETELRRIESETDSLAAGRGWIPRRYTGWIPRQYTGWQTLTWGVKVGSVQLLPVGPKSQSAAEGATPGEKGRREHLGRAVQ